MKLPSVRHLAEQFTKTFFRFPFALSSALVGTVAWISVLDQGEISGLAFLENLAFLGFLGISLFTAITLLGERLRTSFRTVLLANIGGVIVLTAYFLSLPQKMLDQGSAHLIRYVLFGAGLHFLVAVGLFFRRGEGGGFWQFNKSLFLRFLTAALYSGVLYVGVAGAILAVDQLFEAHIDSKRYLELWVFVVGVFNTWFFLAGVPEDLDTLDAETDYPKGLKVFTQYVLLPLVLIYLVILYAYTAKIVVEWNWPKGWVGNLVLGFSIFGILSLLLVHPIKERMENTWIRIVSKYYYVALIPLVFLLLLAIWLRISEYGLTEKRYFVVILGIWLGFIVGYFLLSKTKSIKIIPGTLCALAFVTSFGPWGAMSLSEANQIGRLREVLTRTGILRGEKIQKPTQRLQFEDSRRISSVIQYLSEVHGLKGIEPWFGVRLDTVGSGSTPYGGYNRPYNRPRLVVEMMGVTYVDQWQTAAVKNLSFQPSRVGVVDVRGYDYLFQDLAFGTWDTVKTLTANGREWRLSYSPSMLSVRLSGRRDNGESVEFDLRPMISKLEEEYGKVAYATEIPSAKMSLEQNTHSLRANLRFNSITVEKVGDRLQGNYMQAALMIGEAHR